MDSPIRLKDMPIRAECSAGHAMMVPDHRAGTQLRCPRCGVELRVPGTPLKATPPAVAVTAVPKAGEPASAVAAPTVSAARTTAFELELSPPITAPISEVASQIGVSSAP